MIKWKVKYLGYGMNVHEEVVEADGFERYEDNPNGVFFYVTTEGKDTADRVAFFPRVLSVSQDGEGKSKDDAQA